MPKPPASPSSPKQKDREVEAAVIIRSENPGLVAGRLARLAKLGSYRLLKERTVHIRDRYFDTPAGDLGKRRVALRIREVDGARLITVKADSFRQGSTTSRLEIEDAWSPHAL